MTVTTVEKDPANLTLTVHATFDADVDRVWQLWADPRQLERWWGPPAYPATFVAHDLAVGANCTYFMTSPQGDRHHGWWQVTDVEPPRTLEVEDGFAHADGTHNTDLPTMRIRVSLADRGDGGTDVSITSRFGSVEQLEKMLEMGLEEGLQEAMGQMDDVLVAA